MLDAESHPQSALPNRSPAVDPQPLRRLLGTFRGAVEGPALVLVGSLHGNEPAGAQALVRLARRLEAGPGLRSGDLTALCGNLPALRVGTRFIQHDLNRCWDRDRIERIERSGPHGPDEEQLLELRSALVAAGSRHRGPLYALDLHTTSGDGPPFVNISTRIARSPFADGLPAPKVLGVGEHLRGTMIDWLIGRGYEALGVEGGQHDDPRSIDHLEALAWLALANLGMLEEADGTVQRTLEHSRAVLGDATGGLPAFVEIIDRYAIEDAREFAMEPGFRSFQEVEPGTLLARHHGTVVRSPGEGRILMPLYQNQGEEGFFLVREVPT